MPTPKNFRQSARERRLAGRTMGVVGAMALLVGSAAAQVADAPWRSVAAPVDSGRIAGASGVNGALIEVYATELFAVESEWVRVEFDEITLAGDPSLGTGAVLVIESLLDGDRQYLNSVTAAQWGNTSAYFNGPGVRLSVMTPAGLDGESRVRVRSLMASIPPVGRSDRSLCDGADDRVPSTDNRSARVNRNCTAWLINDISGGFLSAGHCRPTGTGAQIVEFNVPPSSSTGAVQASAVADQYSVDLTSQQHNNGGVGNDWWYFGVFPNSNHGQMPWQRYGVRHTLSTAPATGTQPIRVTGYGTVTTPIPATRNQTQQTHAGPYAGLSGTIARYRPDTTGGNSGSPVIDDNANVAIAIHTHAGCTSTGGANQGTALQLPALQTALANPLGVCRSGKGVIGGTTYLIADRQNNFGTVRVAPDNFAAVKQVGANWQGLTYQPGADRFLGVDAARNLYAISTTGVATLLGAVTGAPGTALAGLAFEPSTGSVLALVPSTGQLVRINLTTLAATTVGPAAGAGVRAMEFDRGRNVLWILTLSPALSLARMDTSTGAVTTVGALGIAGAVCPDLCVRESDGTLLTVNATTGDLLSINPATGVASVLGATGGIFGTALGMADRSSPPLTCPADFNGVGGVSVQDIFDFLTAWFAGLSTADFNGVGGVSVQDIFDFLTAWFAGCP